MQYRNEIDGLRAIAVLPVIFFHGGLFGVTGGYIGVDIFFVISGYLITSIILGEIEQNRFSVINFYERRARRILPALSVVLFFTTIAAFILMPADLLKSYSQSLVSVATFLSNVFFYLTSGYFSTASDEKPLLHTWSLAIEEQYYLFFPVMVSMLWFIGRKYLTLLIVLLLIISLLLSQYLSSQHVIANFYLIFSRAWELFAGSLIAFTDLHKYPIKKWKSEILAFVGLILIIYAAIYFDKHTPFPSFYALIPVLGAGLIIAFSNGNTFVGKFLSNKIFVGIGLISYSLYLWHQPLFAFLRMKTIGEPSESMFIRAIFLAFLLAFLSYEFIEKPFRNKTAISRTSILRFSIASIFIFLSMGLSGHFYNGFESRFETSIHPGTIEFSPKRKACHTEGEKYLKPDAACRYFGSNITWAIFGDSHTVEPGYALAKLLKPHNEGLLHLSFSFCPPSLLFEVKKPGCTKWINEALTYLEKNKSIKHVLLGFRYSAFLYGDQLDAYPDLPNRDPIDQFTKSSRKKIIAGARETYWQGFSEIVHRLLTSGKEVYLLYPIPELPVGITNAVIPFTVFGGKTILDLEKSTSSKYYFSRNNFIIKKLDTLPYGDNLHAIKPFEILCHSEYCPAVINGDALYFDDDHLSVTGASKLLAGSVIAKIIQANNSLNTGR